MKFAASLNSRSARGGLLNIWRRIVVLEVGQSIAAAPLSTAVTKSDLGIFDDCLFYFLYKKSTISFAISIGFNSWHTIFQKPFIFVSWNSVCG